MKRQRPNNTPLAQKRAMMERRAHDELDAITKQLQQIRMEAKYKYIVSKSPGIQANQASNQSIKHRQKTTGPQLPSRFSRSSHA
jgi:hypothetical protein